MFPRAYFPLFHTPVSYWPWASGITAGTFAHLFPFVPTEAAGNAVWDYDEPIVRGEGRDLLFYPTAPGTTSPEAPTALDPAIVWQVVCEGFGLTAPLVYTSAAGNLLVDTTFGTIRGMQTAAETLTMVHLAFGTVSLWMTGPTDDQKVLIRRVRTRAKS